MSVVRYTLLYDADCGLCRWATAKLLDRDREGGLRPLAIQDERAVGLLPGMSQDQRLASLHLVAGGGRILSGGEAVPELLRRLPGGRVIGGAAAAIQPFTNLVYGLVVANRTRLGRLVREEWRARADATIRAREGAAPHQ